MTPFRFLGCSAAAAVCLWISCQRAWAAEVDAVSTLPASRDIAAPKPPSTAGEPEASAGTTAAVPDSSVEEVTVTGSSLTEAIDQARFSESIVDVLTAKDFAMTGDTNVVDALSRVTGVTTVGDKYVYVRGLGERYSSTLFNGAMLPSPDPVRRVVPLDLFPSGVMDQLSVQKTYAPYLPADFAGGSVQLKTRGVPAEAEARLSLSSEYRTGTTFTKKRWYDGSGSDWTGYDGSYRHLPGHIDDLQTADPSEVQDLGLRMNRSFDTTDKLLPPNFKLKGSLARNYDLYMGKVGLLVGGQGQNDWLQLAEQRESRAPNKSTTEDNTTNSIKYSGLTALQWRPSRAHTIDANVFYTHNTDKRYITDNTFNRENDNYVSDINTEWEEQSLWTTQVAGTHNPSHMHNLGFDWGLTYSTASRVKPDTRFYRYFVNTDANDMPLWNQKTFDTDVSGNERDWEVLSDDAWDAHLNGELPLKLTESITSTLKAGARYFDKQRDSERRVFHFSSNNPGHRFDDLPIDQIFQDSNISPAPSDWHLSGFRNPLDSYSAEEQTIAGYAQAETEFGSKFHWMVGARYETSTQTVTQDPTTPHPSTELKDDGFHPATELTWLFTDALQLRAAYSQTVNRPDLREISDASYLDPETRFRYHGNTDIQVAELKNYDLRLEWYHGFSDSVQIAGFYKDLTKPIEEVYQPAGNTRTWQNAKSGMVYGIEGDFRQSLSLLGRWAENFSLRGNAAWIGSEAKTDPAAPTTISPLTHPTHALQGQSPWIVNLQLMWQHLPSDTDATIAFNMAGKYIKDLGTNAGANGSKAGFDDSYQMPKPQLDFTLRHGFRLFGGEYDLTFKARNLVDPKNEITRSSFDAAGNVNDSWTELSYRKGRLFSIEIGRDF